MSSAVVPCLEAQGVTVKFGGLTAVNDVNLRVLQGKVVGLIGPNGAGKSTLFDVLSGLRTPHAGTVFISGKDVTKASTQERATLGMARTFQHPQLFRELTVRDHVTLSCRMVKSPRRVWTDLLDGSGFRRIAKAEKERVDQIIHELNLSDVQDQSVAGFPLGLARLVEIARCFALEPRLLLLDEASSGLDTADTERLASTLRRMVDTHGISLLMVEHDVELVLGMADWVYVLDFGTLIAGGTPEEIRANPDVRAAYLGEPVDPKTSNPSSNDKATA